MQEVKLYLDYKVRDLFDEIVYIGPASQWETVSGALAPERVAEYLQELNSRSMIRFGRPYGGGWTAGNGAHFSFQLSGIGLCRRPLRSAVAGLMRYGLVTLSRIQSEMRSRNPGTNS
jgi:hypothetical protein